MATISVLNEQERDPFYRILARAEPVSKEESDEIFEQLDSLSEDELKIVRSDTYF